MVEKPPLSSTTVKPTSPTTPSAAAAAGQVSTSPETEPLSPKAMISRRSSTASEKRGSKSRTRSKSPFRSFRWKKSKPPPEAYPDHYSDDEQDPRSRTLESTDEELEGMLTRKHEWESVSKKAANRSWDRVCVVLKGTQILFYKDQKSYKMAPDQTFRGEGPVELVEQSGEVCTAEVASDYHKKKHVFRLRLPNGGDYLFHARDDDEMNTWVSSINAQTASDSEAGPSKSQTLPSGEKRDEPKKRSFFTLKKN